MSRFNATLEEFAQAIVDGAKLNLSVKRVRHYTTTKVRSNRVASGTLKKSIYYDIKTRDNTGRFVDREVIVGVKGAAKEYAAKVEYGTPPRSVKANKIMVGVWKWIRIKPVKLRDSQGRFVPMTDRAVAKAAQRFAKAIARRGIPGEFFLRDSIRYNMKKYKGRLTQAAFEDVKTKLGDLANDYN